MVYVPFKALFGYISGQQPPKGMKIYFEDKNSKARCPDSQ